MCSNCLLPGAHLATLPRLGLGVQPQETGTHLVMNGSRGLGRCLDRGNKGVTNPGSLPTAILTVLHAFYVDGECRISEEPQRLVALNDLMLKTTAHDRTMFGINTFPSNKFRNFLHFRRSEEHFGSSVPFETVRYGSPISKRNANAVPFGLTPYRRRKRQVIRVTLIHSDTVSSDDDRTINRTPRSLRINAPVAQKRSQTPSIQPHWEIRP